MKRLRAVLENSPLLKAELVDLDFKTFFGSRGSDYSGEEVRLAQKVSCWANIEPSFPPEVGALDIREFCEGGVLHSFALYQPHWGNHLTHGADHWENPLR
jgi:hypothetical protein